MSGINEIKMVKKTGLCHKCREPHFQCEFTGNGTKKFQSKTTTQQAQKTTMQNIFTTTKQAKVAAPLKTFWFPSRTRNLWKIKVGPSTSSNVGALYVMGNT